MELLYTYYDGSKLYKISAKALTKIPVWKGNRIIDLNHVNNIKQSIDYKAQLLDSGYKIIQYQEMDEKGKPIKRSYIIDGQHRLAVVIDYFENVQDAPDFNVTVTEIRVESESDAIDYFNKINNVKPQQFELDPNLLINKYLKKLEETYNTRKKNDLLRTGLTRRPYLSVDKLREALKKRFIKLKKISCEKFVIECKLINKKLLQELELLSLNDNDKEKNIIQKSIEMEFALAWDDKFKWLDIILPE